MQIVPVERNNTMSNDIIPTNARLNVTLKYIKSADGCYDVDIEELVAFAMANSDSDAKRDGGSRFAIFTYNELIHIKTKKALEKFLNTIRCPIEVEAFRNFEHGVTIKLL